MNALSAMTPVTTNENSTICAACGGACCRTRPGIESPDRFLLDDDPASLLCRLLVSGTWVLDRHLGLPVTSETRLLPNRMDITTWYPRPATRQEQLCHSIAGLPQPGECVFLGSEGCLLPFLERPYLCRALEPGDEECHSPWSRADAALSWWPLQAMVREAVAGCCRQHPGLEWLSE